MSPLLHEPLLRLCSDAGLLNALEPLQRDLQLASRLANNEALPPRVRATAFDLLTREMANEIHASFCGAMEDATKRAALTESLEWLLRLWRACCTRFNPPALLEGAQQPLEPIWQQLGASVCREWLTGAEAQPIPTAALSALLPSLQDAMLSALSKLSVGLHSYT